MKIYNELKNKQIIKSVNEIFYDKVYEHPWLSLFFEGVTKEFIIQQQTDFMTGALGGPNYFHGRNPTKAHPHIHITEQLYDLREDLLIEALAEAKAPQILIDAWLKIDEAFRKAIAKRSVSECKKRYTMDKILDFNNPSTSHLTSNRFH